MNILNEKVMKKLSVQENNTNCIYKIDRLFYKFTMVYADG